MAKSEVPPPTFTPHRPLVAALSKQFMTGSGLQARALGAKQARSKHCTTLMVTTPKAGGHLLLQELANRLRVNWAGGRTPQTTYTGLSCAG